MVMLYGQPTYPLLATSLESQPVTILTGASSVGKRTAVQKFLFEHPEYQHVRLPNTLVETARNITPQLQQLSERPTLISVEVTKNTTQAFFNALLIALEDVSEACHVVIISDVELPETILSRGIHIRFQLIPHRDMLRILEMHKVSEAGAELASRMSGGRVSQAMYYLQLTEAKRDVFAVLRAFESRSMSELRKVASNWTKDRTELLKQWCIEDIQQDPVVFKGAEFDSLPENLAVKLLLVCNTVVYPPLFVRGVLTGVLAKEIAHAS